MYCKLRDITFLAAIFIIVSFSSTGAYNLKHSNKDRNPKVRQFSANLWMELDRYKPGDRYKCRFQCRHHQICMVHANHKDYICTNKHDLRKSRRLFKKLSETKIKPPHQTIFLRPVAPAKDHIVATNKLPIRKQNLVLKTDQNLLKKLIDDNTVKIGKNQKAEINIENTVIQLAAARTRQNRLVSEAKSTSRNDHKQVVCSKKQFDSLRRQLADWFGALHKMKAGMSQALKHHKHKCDCADVSIWMFHELDTDSNLSLTHSELMTLEANNHEKCMASFLESCNHDNDGEMSRKEWCCCFSHITPPCLESKQNSSPGGHALIGAYVPQCDENGYFRKLQCHASTGECWCVDMNGNEVRDTRMRGPAAHCDGLDALGRRVKPTPTKQG